MTVRKLSISVPAEVEETIKAAAAEEGKPVSAWLAEAATEKARAVVMDFSDAEPIPSWPHERSRVQATDVLTRDVALGAGPASPDGLPWREDEARDLFADIADKGRAAKAPIADEGWAPVAGRVCWGS